jgi:hypothetical protein
VITPNKSPGEARHDQRNEHVGHVTVDLHAPGFTAPPHKTHPNREGPVDQPRGRIPNGIGPGHFAITSSNALTDASTPRVTEPSGSILNSGE